MKFGETLAAAAVPEWRASYVDYGALKKVIKEVAKAASSDSIRDDHLAPSPADAAVIPSPGADRFASLLLAEVQKAELFYLHLQSDLETRIAQLEFVASAAKVTIVETLSRDVLRWGDFRALNSTAAIKIMKKYEKKTGLPIKARLMPSLLMLEFFVPKDESIFARCNTLYTKARAFAGIEYAPRSRSQNASKDAPLPFPKESDSLTSPRSVALPSQSHHSLLSRFLAIRPETHALWLGIALLVQLVALFFFKEPIQASSGHLTLWLQARMGIGGSLQAWSMALHNSISSHLWLLFCSLVYWLYDDRRGLTMFCFVTAGFAVKSLAKNLIRSPRVFWLFAQHNALYCGTGFSLPSGHSMVSAMTLGFAIYAFRHPAFVALFVAYAVFVFINVIYIGTHTVADVIVGWTFGLFLLALVACTERAWAALSSVRSQMAAIGASVLLVLFFDALEYQSHDATGFDADRQWQTNMERVCHLAPGSGARKMQLQLKFSSTPLILGIGLACLLRTHLLAHSPHSASAAQRILQAAIGVFVSHRSSKWIKYVAMNVLNAPDLAYHLCNLLDPIWVVCGAVYAASCVQRLAQFGAGSWEALQRWRLDARARALVGIAMPADVPVYDQRRLLDLLLELRVSAAAAADPSEFLLVNASHPEVDETMSAVGAPPISTPARPSAEAISRGRRTPRANARPRVDVQPVASLVPEVPVSIASPPRKSSATPRASRRKSRDASSLWSIATPPVLLVAAFVVALVFFTFFHTQPVSRAFSAHMPRTSRGSARAKLYGGSDRVGGSIVMGSANSPHISAYDRDIDDNETRVAVDSYSASSDAVLYNATANATTEVDVRVSSLDASVDRYRRFDEALLAWIADYRRESRYIPRIYVHGAPLVGKGTLCALLANRLGVVHVSVHSLLKAAASVSASASSAPQEFASAVASESIGARIRHYTMRGELVPDELLIPILVQRLREPDCVQRGWVLEGFPRTDAQAAAIETIIAAESSSSSSSSASSASSSAAQSPLAATAFVFLDMADALVASRADTRRQVLATTGKIYSPDADADVRLLVGLGDALDADAVGQTVAAPTDASASTSGSSSLASASGSPATGGDSALAFRGLVLRRLRAFYDQLIPLLARFRHSRSLMRVDGQQSAPAVLRAALTAIARALAMRTSSSGRAGSAPALPVAPHASSAPKAA